MGFFDNDGGEGFVGEFAVGNFFEGDVHKGHFGANGDEGAVALSELANALGYHVD